MGRGGWGRGGGRGGGRGRGRGRRRRDLTARRAGAPATGDSDRHYARCGGSPHADCPEAAPWPIQDLPAATDSELLGRLLKTRERRDLHRAVERVGEGSGMG